MSALFQFVVSCLLFCFAQTASIPSRRASSPYAPVTAECPRTPLLRPADGISESESCYIENRHRKASVSLLSWANSHGYFELSPDDAPVVALAGSGGGYRALLEGAGLIQGFDGREAQRTGVSGLYQGLTYQTGLSGGSWLLFSFAGNNYPTITSLREGLWEDAFQNTLLVPGLAANAASVYAEVVQDVDAKADAGFSPSITDPWGRLLSWQLLYGDDGGVRTTLSALTRLSNFTDYNVPYPIVTALGVDEADGQCLPTVNSTQYEFHPFEFGSWDGGVNAFTPTSYLGTRLSNGLPINRTCYQNFDNLGYVFGTSSSLFALVCSDNAALSANFQETITELGAFLANDDNNNLTKRDDYAVYPNPFRDNADSYLVSDLDELTLVDGGIAGQGNPIWPLLHRDVDVILVGDNNADTASLYPNGSELHTTYVEARDQGLTNVPEIPTANVFVANGYHQRPTFFGCYDDDKITFIYLPNYNYTYPSGQSTFKVQYNVSETDGMIANGVQIAAKGGDPCWPTCLACGILKKASDSLPHECGACFDEYCYN